MCLVEPHLPQIPESPGGARTLKSQESTDEQMWNAFPFCYFVVRQGNS